MERIRANASGLHLEALKIVKTIFPNYGIKNDFPVKIGAATLFLDIYIPEIKIAVEVDGAQHDKFSKFFHGDSSGFLRSKKNDAMKEEYCKANNIAIIRVTKKELTRDIVLNKIRLALKESRDE